MGHRRTGYWRVGIGVLVLLLATVILYIASPLIADQMRPVMRTASTPDQCTVVPSRCHGERVGINEEYAGVYQALALRGGCDGPAQPIDDLNYSAGWMAGRCETLVALPEDCVDRYSEARCDAMRSVITETYGE